MLKIRSKICCNFGRTSQGDVVGRVSANYIALLIYTCFCAYTIHARSTTNGKIWREIQNPQMFETDRAPTPFPQQSTLVLNILVLIFNFIFIWSLFAILQV
jgi:hypothetical protein